MTINPRILLSGASIAAASILGIGATFAFFSDNETSTNNVFATGTLDLVLCDSDENTGAECPEALEAATDGTTATFGSANMIPDSAPVSGTLTLRNNGSIDGNHVDIKFTNTITQSANAPGNATTNDLDQYLEVTTLTYDGVDQLPLTDTNSNGRNDLADLAAQTGDDLVELAGIAAGESKDLVMAVKLHSSAPNDLQGDSVDVSLSVDLHQATHASE